MERRKLSAEEIEANLSKLDDWTAANDKLSKKFEFANFSESLSFVNKVGEIADRSRPSSGHFIRLGLRRIFYHDARPRRDH